MISIWDLYLDDRDAAALLHALAVVERHRAVREPLPLDDPPRLLERLELIVGIARDEAVHWAHETEDRRLEAEVDGGRWGGVEAARTMAQIAADLAAGSREIAAVCDIARADLAARLPAEPDPAVTAADAATTEAARRLLAGDRKLGPGAHNDGP